MRTGGWILRCVDKIYALLVNTEQPLASGNTLANEFVWAVEGMESGFMVDRIAKLGCVTGRRNNKIYEIR